MSSITALARVPFGRYVNPPEEPHEEPPRVGPDGKDVFRILAHQPNYAPPTAEERWRQSNACMVWALGAVPTSMAVASSFVAGSTVMGGALAAASLVSAGVGCATVILAPILVPTGAYLAMSAAITMAWGGMLAAGSVGVGFLVAGVQGAQGVGYAALAVTSEFLPSSQNARRLRDQ